MPTNFAFAFDLFQNSAISLWIPSHFELDRDAVETPKILQDAALENAQYNTLESPSGACCSDPLSSRPPNTLYKMFQTEKWRCKTVKRDMNPIE